MQKFIDKKLFAIGFLLIALIILPVLITSLQTRQENRSRASLDLPTATDACGSFTIQNATVPLGLTTVGSEIWVPNYDSSSISRLEANGLQQKSPITFEEGLFPLTLTNAGDTVWVIGAFEERIFQVSSNGTILDQTIILPHETSEDASLPVDALVVGSQVWVTDTTNHKIHRLDFSGRMTNNPPIVLPENTFPTTLTRTNDEIWVAGGFETSTIYRFNTDGTRIGDSISGNDLGLVLDLLGVGSEIWVSHARDDGSFGILQYDTSGKVIQEILAIEAPAGLSVVGDTVWVTEPAIDFLSNGKIYVLNNDGTQHFCDQPPPTLSFSVLLHGVGNSGDSTNPTNHSFSNKTPVITEIPLGVNVETSSGSLVSQGFGTVLYDGANGVFKGDIVLEFPVDEGSYTLKLKTPGYLSKKIQDFPLATLQNAAFESIEFIAGDVNEDNSLDILDYNILLDCGYGSTRVKSQSKSRCYEHYPYDENADLNLDDVVDQKDYNLFLREKPIRSGE
ncbi:MAG TPA: hypothetical protein VJC10_02095 [Patescibacteria group bacterium]|nr:hypothetical protein [Patescibacteria group bacterium]